MSEWISVKDRLPEGNGRFYGEFIDDRFEESEPVLVWGRPKNRAYEIDPPSYGVGVCVYDRNDPNDVPEFSGELFYSWDLSACDVTHWMPLPEPPKEG